MVKISELPLTKQPHPNGMMPVAQQIEIAHHDKACPRQSSGTKRVQLMTAGGETKEMAVPRKANASGETRMCE